MQVRCNGVVVYEQVVPGAGRGYDDEEERARDIALENFAVRLRVLLAAVTPYQMALAQGEKEE